MENILSNLSALPHKSRKRKGRGPASGRGKTAGRGTKGQYARTGRKHKPAFEGGQTPLIRRIPKRGFTNPFGTKYEIVNVGTLEKFEPNTVVDQKFLKEKNIIKSRLPIKILGGGELTRPLTVKAHKFSKSAKEKIESAKGKIEEIPARHVPKSPPSRDPDTAGLLRRGREQMVGGKVKFEPSASTKPSKQLAGKQKTDKKAG